jgi:hypothetical protein
MKYTEKEMLAMIKAQVKAVKKFSDLPHMFSTDENKISIMIELKPIVKKPKAKRKIRYEYDNEWFAGCLDDQIAEGTVITSSVIEDALDDAVRDLFEMDTFDNPKHGERLIDYKGSTWRLTAEEDGCCEATGEHRIVYWNLTATEITKAPD